MELAREWYALLSLPSQFLAGSLGQLSSAFGLAPVSAFLFGLVGAVAPCQLTTNLSAMAYLGRNGGRSTAAREASAFLLGKALVYSALGALAFVLGTQLQRAAIPVALVTRRALGPVLLVIGLSLLGAFRLRGGFGTRLAARLRTWGAPTWPLGTLGPRSGTRGAFVMGGAFGLAFCPTLFWLFFGLTLPLGLQSPLGLAFPALFALGTSLPVLLLGGALTAGAPATIPTGFARASQLVSRIAGAVFLVAGINDTLTYWAL